MKNQKKFTIPQPNKKPRGTLNGYSVQISVLLPPEVFEAVEKYADQEQRKLSNAALALICRGLNEIY